MTTPAVTYIKELTKQCSGIPKLLVEEILNWIHHVSIEPCKPPEEPEVNIEECLKNYKNLANQFFGIEMPMGQER